MTGISKKSTILHIKKEQQLKTFFNVCLTLTNK